jgi:hypothetical protein
MATLTVEELIDKLALYDPSMPVVAAWDGSYSSIEIGHIAVEESEWGNVLVLDVDSHGTWKGQD